VGAVAAGRSDHAVPGPRLHLYEVTMEKTVKLSTLKPNDRNPRTI
jgi:hypothetical protein